MTMVVALAEPDDDDEERPVFCQKHGYEREPCEDYWYQETTGGEE